jgi:outer membrane protein assembly factor BamB
VFEIKPTQGVDWNDTLMITGNFLKSVVSQIMYDGEIVPILSSGEWGFKVPVYTEFSKKKEPNVVARIRGELYDLGKLFSINPTKIAPGQTVNFKPHQPQIIKGENFAPFLEGFNHLVDETGDSIPYYLSTFPTENELSIVFFENTIFEKRLTSVRIRNFDLLSENSFNVLNTSPFAPVVKYSSDIWAYDQKSVTIGETGYFYSDGKLYNVSLNGTFNRGFKMNLPSNLSQRFFFNQFGGKIYTGGGIDEQLIDSHAFYAIDPATNSIQRLADIPKEVTWMSRIYQLQGDLIFEGGMRRTEEGELVLSSARYRYKLDSDSWEKIDEGAEPIQSTYYYSQDLVFNHNNQIFAIQQREYGSQIRLQKLNTNDLVWETLNTYQTNGSIFSNEPMIIDGKAFIQLPGELIQVNLQNSEIRGYSSIFQNYSWSTSRVPSFYFNKKGYFHIYNLLVEFDPAYLD